MPCRNVSMPSWPNWKGRLKTFMRARTQEDGSNLSFSHTAEQMDILPIPEKQREPSQSGGWPKDMARRLCDMGTLDLQRFILQKADTGLSWACVDHYRHLLSKIFSTAKKWSYYSGENPAAGVELPEKKSVREKHVLTPEQISQLLSVLGEPVRTMFLLAILTGLRIGEVIGLRWRDIELDSGQLRVEQACYRGHLGSPKTQGSKRCLPLPLGLVEILVQYHLRCLRIGPDDLLFQISSGRPLSDTKLLHRHLVPAGQEIGY